MVGGIESVTRRHRLLVAGMATLLWAATGTGFAAVAQAADAAAGETIQVQIEPADPSGPSGLAIMAAVEGGTAVQVLVPGAPEGTTAVIHPGSCDAVDPTLVGLVGEIEGSAQVQATVPVSLGELADGGHVIALHPGLDLATTIACGAIPGGRGPGSTTAPAVGSRGADRDDRSQCRVPADARMDRGDRATAGSRPGAAGRRKQVSRRQRPQRVPQQRRGVRGRGADHGRDDDGRDRFRRSPRKRARSCSPRFRPEWRRAS